MSDALLPSCARCGEALPSPEALACARCGALVYAAKLTELSAEAKWQEQYNPAQAGALWEECLKRLPPESGQYAAVEAEVARLRAVPPSPVAVTEPGGMPLRRQESLPVAVMKTGLSMALSIAVYQFSFGWGGALGFVLLILVHELGHVAANVYYHLPASPPIFIPYLGAVIGLRKNPPNARVEAVMGIAGPIAGTAGALLCFAYYLCTGSELALNLSWFGFTINLFNLLPVPPLDGGRVAAAISPWVWVVGLAGLAWMVADEFRSHQGAGILLLVLIIALPRIIRTLKPSGRRGAYYAIGKVAPVVIGTAYLVLLGLLVALRWYTERHMANGGLF